MTGVPGVVRISALAVPESATAYVSLGPFPGGSWLAEVWMSMSAGLSGLVRWGLVMTGSSEASQVSFASGASVFDGGMELGDGKPMLALRAFANITFQWGPIEVWREFGSGAMYLVWRVEATTGQSVQVVVAAKSVDRGSVELPGRGRTKPPNIVQPSASREVQGPFGMR